MTTKLKPIPPLRAKFLEAAEQRRLSANTQKAYAKWIREFIQFHHPRKVEPLGPSEISSYQTFLVTKRGVSGSTQRLAFNALVFLFRYVLEKEIGLLPNVPRALRRGRRNHALTRAEFQLLLSHIPIKFQLIFLVMYGCGLRITEASSLQVRDILLDEEVLIVRNTKARSDRAIRIPSLLKTKLQEHLVARRNWERSSEKRRHPEMSHAQVDRLTASDWNNQYVFVGDRAFYDEISKRFHLKPLSPSFLQRIFKRARTSAQLGKPVTPHSLRYSYASEAAHAGNNLAELQITLGHKDPNTTARYIDVTETIRKVSSPLDSLPLPENETTTENTESITPTTLPPSRFTAICNYLLNLLKIQTKN